MWRIYYYGKVNVKTFRFLLTFMMEKLLLNFMMEKNFCLNNDRCFYEVTIFFHHKVPMNV